MLLLSKLKSSADVIRELIGDIESKSSWHEKTCGALSDFISKRSKVTFAYTGAGFLPSKALFFSLSILTPEKEFHLRSASQLAYHYLPYIDDAGGVILFVGSVWERNELLRVVDALNVMNTDYIVILPSKPDEITSRKIERDRAVIPPADLGVIDFIYLALKTSVKATIKMTGASNLRIKRLEEELNNTSSLHEDLHSLQGDFSLVTEKILTSEAPLAILYTPGMEVPALLFQYMLWKWRKTATAVDLSVAPVEDMDSFQTIIMYTGVEEDMFKETNFRLLKRGKRPLQFKADFDPISNQLYASIIVYSALRDVSRR